MGSLKDYEGKWPHPIGKLARSIRDLNDQALLTALSIDELEQKLVAAQTPLGTIQRYGDPEYLEHRDAVQLLMSRPSMSKVGYDVIYEKSLPICEANDRATQENIRIRDNMVGMMVGLGMPLTYRYQKSRNKWITENTDWYKGIYEAFRPYCQPGWVSSLNKWLEGINQAVKDRETRKAEQEAMQKRMDMETVRERTAVAQLVALAQRYDLPITSDWGEVMETILDRSPLLSLAHDMLSVRLDWEDGCDNVQRALDKYKTALYKGDGPEREDVFGPEVVALIQETIDSFNGGDRDGRIFRDRKPGYDFLFEVVKNNDYHLYKDYMEAKEWKRD